VIVWRLNSNIGIDTFYQRIGRAGRDTDEPGLALLFVTKRNRAAGLALKKKSDSEAVVDKFNIVATIETWPQIQGFLSELYMGPKGTEATTWKSRLKRAMEGEIVPTMQFTVRTSGCRFRPALIAFDDENKFYLCA